MTVERIQLLRNTGQFDSVNAGAQLPLTKLSLIYAENGRGKTTVATILRSLSTGEAKLIDERQRLGSAHLQNVCSGIEIETAHRQNLHELILGAQGVQLNAVVLEQIAAVEQHNRTLRERGDAIPAATRGALTVDAFCALKPDPQVDVKIQEAERQLAAARAADAVQRQEVFLPLSLPGFDLGRRASFQPTPSRLSVGL
ncbi:hypothetical protein ACFYE9_16440 [Rhizobium leguminosarum]|nr:hypothetical protein [Rhizobium leguminosarum]